MHTRGPAPGEIHSEKGSSKLRVLIQAEVKDVSPKTGIENTTFKMTVFLKHVLKFELEKA